MKLRIIRSKMNEETEEVANYKNQAIDINRFIYKYILANS